MKTPLSFYLIAAVAGALACSDEGGTDRNAGGSGQVAQAGSSGSGGAAGTGNGSAGSGQSSGGSAGSGSSGVNTGDAFAITEGTATANGATALVVDSAGNTGIDGIAQVIKSPLGTEVTSGIKDGALCMSGTTAVVPGMDYANYWGAEIDLDLKLVDSEGNGSGGGAVADAGADAGAGDAGPPPARTPIGWDPSVGNVVGFSFKIEGPTVPVAFRFKGLPLGADSSAVTYCYPVVAAASGATVVNVRFDQITRDCWSAGGAPLMTETFAPDNPEGKLLRTISWQIPADITVPFPFDFCVSDIKPILGN